MLIGLTLVAFGLRVYHLGSPPLLWDEGWSIGLSRLPLGEIARITALDVHPPLYYVLLKGWLALGPHEFVTRFLSVMAGVLTVPLSYHAGRAWRGRPVGLLTAFYVTIAPPLVYYSQITRMFAVCVMFLVLGTYGLLRALIPNTAPRPGHSEERGDEESHPSAPNRSPNNEILRSFQPFRMTSRSFQLLRMTFHPFQSLRMTSRSFQPLRMTSCSFQPLRMTFHPFQPLKMTCWVKPHCTTRPNALNRGRPWIPYLMLVIGAAGAVYSFYYAGFVLAALFVYALIAAPGRWKTTLAGFGTVALLYLPWVLYAAPAMLNRVRERTGFAFAVGHAVELAVGGFYGLVFPYGIGWPAVYVVLGVVVVGSAFGTRRLGRWALLPVLAVGATLFGAALGAQAHMFAARYTIVASPFLALALAGALGLLARRRWVFALGLTLILLTTAPTITNYVYSKSYEVFDPFDPSTDWQVLHDLADADDIVFFNVLSLAGTYERYRTAGDPPWSYALRWDPVIESLDVATARIDAATPPHGRLWFVLYKGTVAANADLKSWLDQRFYPTAAPGWHEDTLYLAYVDPRGPWHDVALGARFGNIVLDAARYTPGDPTSAVIGVDLVWHADGPIERDAKVFVHLYDEAGNLIAQHDSVPVNGTRPPTTWQAGERLTDRHGLALPRGLTGQLHLVTGLYDPTTGERLRTSDGRDIVVIGTVSR